MSLGKENGNHENRGVRKEGKREYCTDDVLASAEQDREGPFYWQGLKQRSKKYTGLGLTGSRDDGQDTVMSTRSGVLVQLS